MADKSLISLTFPEPDIAVLTLDDPTTSVNLLSRPMLAELDRRLDELERQKDLSGLVINSAKPGVFIAGADIKEFVAAIDSPPQEVIEFSQMGQELFGRLSKTPWVTVAAIDGICVGGGAELAVWCDRRVMTDHEKTAFGFPEVKLGLFPGWGGTARTPRMIGLPNAVELISGGDNIDAHAAYKLGLANDLVSTSAENNGASLLAAAIRMIRAEQESGQFRHDRETWSAPISIGETELGFLGATASAYIQQQTKGHYPAPLAALELMLGSAGLDIDAACQREVEEFVKLFGSPINRALLNVFFLRDRNKKDPGVPKDVRHREIKSVGVVGAGIMGQGIAAANVKRSIPVVLADVSQEAIARGVQGVLNEVSYNKQTKGPDVERALQFAPFIRGTLGDAEICSADLVIEAVVENADAKKKLFARLEPQLADQTILCSNTSTIPITKLAADLKHPKRFCGLHFFNPVRQMPLVEVIRGERTDDETVATAVAYAKALGKSPVVVGDGTGFLVNRLLLPYMNEAALLLSEGASIKQVERAAKSFGMPMGPITLYDVVGLDTCLRAGQTMVEAFPERVVPATIVEKLVAAGRLGQKNGQGFFDYKPGKKDRGTESPDVEQMIGQLRTETRKFSDDELIQRMFLPMLLEATRVVEEKLVRDVRDVDLALIFGIGFPPFRGGLFFWADTLGATQIVEQLSRFQSLGKRYEPTKLLLTLANNNAKFYD
jgi:3-hydroxyacyl-CoA dehydrogenase/enoyl-CoA hydratase/3-hydroxybutyryl-CoA epimerase/3-hydroxyacyl-CoA dehydrogenase/enoyl-CoA hydratase/3-hydroxybutyryl-CoA epimerase/enoyl-CoA isomerase